MRLEERLCQVAWASTQTRTSQDEEKDIQNMGRRKNSAPLSSSSSSSSPYVPSSITSHLFLVAALLFMLAAHSACGVMLDEDTNSIHPIPSSFYSDKGSSYQYDLNRGVWHYFKRRHHHHHHHQRRRKEKAQRDRAGSSQPKIFYQNGSSESSLPVCSRFGVCNVVDTYGEAWVERRCRCPERRAGDRGGRRRRRKKGSVGTGPGGCPATGSDRDGHTVVDKTRQYKLCEPSKRLRRCSRFFHEISFTRVQYPDNSTQQVMHCRCPRNSVAYLVKRSAYRVPRKEGEDEVGFQFSFACSPKTKLRCKRKEPCRLFSVRESVGVGDGDGDDNGGGDGGGGPSRPPTATQSDLCHCPRRSSCPDRHTDAEGVVPGRTYGPADRVRTYSAYCV